MTLLDQLLLIAVLTVLATAVAGHLRAAGWIATGLYALQFLWLMRMGSLGYDGPQMESSLGFTVFDQTLSWRYDALSWFFAIVTVGAGLASSAFMAGDWGRWYREQGGNLWLLHFTLALNVVTMLLLLGSGDLLSLFIGWELVSWAGFLLMVQAGGPAARAALRYIIYAMAGAMAILAGIVLLYSHAGSLEYTAISASVASLSSDRMWALVLLFGAGFGVKMALLPFHLWQAAAYSGTPGPGAAFLGAISSRMGLYGIVVVLIQLLGITRTGGLEIAHTFIDPAELLAWVAAFTMIVPTYIALRQNDARMLLAWHGIGQGGYMLLGLVIGDSLGSAGGLLHAFNYATYQAALFLSVTAVVYRTGTADLNRLGGLVTRMPLSFLVMLIGIIGLAGIPPMNGFVSKWMIYRSLLLEGRPLLFLASVIATLGTILSVYKLIHNTFLVQPRIEHREVREAPWSMTIPMLALCVVVFATGLMPGLAIEWVAAAQ
ncbi:MAG: proton-conducting transporter membrane subunit, partial [Pseudomonadota bacterium]|nr:proton-conducting transporter membrane subunit [Pseudomonadota bacterium]